MMELLKTTGLLRDHGGRGDPGLLPAVARAEAGASAVAALASRGLARLLPGLLTLHPFAAGRTYAAYGGVPSPWRWAGCGLWMASRRHVGTRSARSWPTGWHGDHRVAADERLIGPGATPCRAGAGRLPGPLR